jgi:hypothetical protein
VIFFLLIKEKTALFCERTQLRVLSLRQNSLSCNDFIGSLDDPDDYCFSSAAFFCPVTKIKNLRPFWFLPLSKGCAALGAK